jgi:hypothetical protein
MAIWYNLWPFGIVCGDLLYFSQFGMLGPRKIWQPWLREAGKFCKSSNGQQTCAKFHPIAMYMLNSTQ